MLDIVSDGFWELQNIVKSENNGRLGQNGPHWCWWRILETVYVGHNFEISATNILKLLSSQISKYNIVIDINVAPEKVFTQR